jgi:hypothetical protein
MKLSATAVRALVAAGAALLVVWGFASAHATTGAIPYPWKNCTHVYTKYPHGVGKLHAYDHTSGTPVTNFKRSTRLYNIAMSYNKRLDAGKDGIACEKL